MLYVETFRHFVEEWIKVPHPKRWALSPWKDKDIYILNLYATSAPKYFTEMPPIFATILLPADFVEENALITDERVLYRGHFSSGSFMLPRRYLLKGVTNSGSTFTFNRYMFTSEGYGNLADANHEDGILIDYLANTPHACFENGSPRFNFLKTRLLHLSERDNIEYRMSTEMIIDMTDPKPTNPDATVLYLIAFPLTGSSVHVRINSRMDMLNVHEDTCKEKIMSVIPTEPCAREYERVRIPFHRFRNLVDNKMDTSVTSTIYYALTRAYRVCTPSIMEFQSTKMVIQGVRYYRKLDHMFLIEPETRGSANSPLWVRLHHHILESLTTLT